MFGWYGYFLVTLLLFPFCLTKECDDRKEEKLDEILKSINPKEAEKIIAKLETKYPKK